MPFLTVKVTKSIVKRNYTSKIVLVIKYFKILLNILPLKAIALLQYNCFKIANCNFGISKTKQIFILPVKFFEF